MLIETLAELRRDEADADAWAFRVMNELGYSMPVLDAFMQVKVFEENGLLAFEEKLREMNPKVRLVVPEAESTHPSWNSRGQALQAFLEGHPPPTLPATAFSTAGLFVPGGGYLKHIFFFHTYAGV